MPEEDESESEVWSSNRLPGFSEIHLPGFPELLYAILNERHEVIPVRNIREWGEWMEGDFSPDGPKKRRVAETSINGWWVSTVFLGLNHGFYGPPRWFETMVFEEYPPPPEIGGKIRQLLDEMQVRYETWAEAEEGHAAIVEMIRCGLF
jgi:hypothetical protein